MVIARQRKGKTVEAPKENNASTGCTGVKKSTKRTCGWHQKATGRSEQFFLEKDVCFLPSTTAQALCQQQLPDKGTCFPETTKKEPVFELDPGRTLNPSAKIKLQLFPLDEGTRIGLEEDGHNPYLELILRSRKKISSVLKRLNSKWGSSGIALGVPILFPYNIRLENLARYRRWTLNDIGISAGDVYAAIGSPAIFRLRYVWFSNIEPNVFGVPSTSNPFEACSQSEDIQKGSSINLEITHGAKKQIEAATEEFKPIGTIEAANAVVAGKLSLDVPVDTVNDEVRMNDGFAQASVLRADSLLDISIGGLLSEASLQGKFNNCDPKLNGSNSGLQPVQLISDSFDAFIAAQISPCPQGLRQSSHASHSSILDAEETCHAFPFQRFSSLGKDVLASCGSAYSGACSQDASSKSFKFSNLAEVNSQSALAQGHACQESKTDILPCSRVYNDESSLGLTGIKWSDSLGPFDLGLSSSRQIINGDSVGISGFVSKQSRCIL